MTARKRPLALLALTALLAGDLVAQTFEDVVSITEIEVPVQVLIDGRAVQGLKRENFELLVDGEPQELTWFEELGPEATGAPEGERRRRPARVEVPDTPDRARSYLVIFDFAFSGRLALERAVDGARAIIDEQSHPTDRIALAIFAEPIGARIVVPFTRDRAGLGLGLDFIESLVLEKPKKNIPKLEALDAWWSGAYDPSALPTPMAADLAGNTRTLIQPLSTAKEPAGFGLPVLRPETPLDDPVYRKARFTSIVNLGSGSGMSAIREMGRSMASLVTMLRDVPEPKHVIWLSDGISGSIFSGTETRTMVLHRVKPMIDALGDTGWVLQAVDVGGIPPPQASVFREPRDPNSPLGAFESAPAVIAGENNASLFYLANETGGELFENYNRTEKATRKLLDRGRASYLLAFQLDEPLDDALRHDVKVRLTPDIPGARVLHRPSFRTARAPKERLLAERRMDAAELALSGRELEEIELRVQPVPLPGDDKVNVPVFVDVSLDRLDIGEKGKKKARLDVHGYALLPDGSVADGFTRQTVFRPRKESDAAIVEPLQLQPGSYELRVVAWDLRSNRRHASSVGLSVPEQTPLAAPLFAAIEKPKLLFAPKRSELSDRLELLRVEGDLFLPDLTPALELGRSRRFLIVSAPGTASGKLAVSLFDQSGARAPEELEVDRIADGPDGEVRYAGRVETASLAAGSYRLEASLEGNAERATVRASSSFWVVDAQSR